VAEELGKTVKNQNLPLAFPHKANVDKNVPKLNFTLNNTAITIMV